MRTWFNAKSGSFGWPNVDCTVDSCCKLSLLVFSKSLSGIPILNRLRKGAMYRHQECIDYKIQFFTLHKCVCKEILVSVFVANWTPFLNKRFTDITSYNGILLTKKVIVSHHLMVRCEPGVSVIEQMAGQRNTSVLFFGFLWKSWYDRWRDAR